jgi:hypothetical protein
LALRDRAGEVKKHPQLKSLMVVKKMLHRAPAWAFGQRAATARKQAGERGAPEWKQVVMQKAAMKRMQHRGMAEAAHSRRGKTAALALSALCVSLLLSNTHGAECSHGLPCSFGGCEFSKDVSGYLDRTGSCPTKTGDLWIIGKGIKGLREGVFSNMGACR